MRKSEALQLKPGDLVVSVKAPVLGPLRVLRVTPKGGIEVEIWNTRGEAMTTGWLPYWEAERATT